MEKYLYILYPYLSTILGLALVVSFVIIFYDFSHSIPSPIEIIEKNDQLNQIPQLSNRITASIDGAILYPDEYTLPAGSIIQDLVDQAGGLKKDQDIDLSNINLASILSDHQQIYIPLKNENIFQPAYFKNISAINSTQSETNGLININNADIALLETLPDIGPKTAQKIIDYRLSNPFDNIEEIMEVSGIGEKTFSNIKNQITI